MGNCVSVNNFGNNYLRVGGVYLDDKPIPAMAGLKYPPWDYMWDTKISSLLLNFGMCASSDDHNQLLRNIPSMEPIQTYNGIVKVDYKIV